jgi:ABC-type methionine transport system ATPase subunit
LQRDPAVMALLTAADWDGTVVHAEIDSVQAHTFGTLTLSLRYRGEPEQSALLSQLRPRLSDLEILGYVRS